MSETIWHSQMFSLICSLQTVQYCIKELFRPVWPQVAPLQQQAELDAITSCMCTRFMPPCALYKTILFYMNGITEPRAWFQDGPWFDPAIVDTLWLGLFFLSEFNKGDSAKWHTDMKSNSGYPVLNRMRYPLSHRFSKVLPPCDL